MSMGFAIKLFCFLSVLNRENELRYSITYEFYVCVSLFVGVSVCLNVYIYFYLNTQIKMLTISQR